jgi:aldehyde dehydrogenase (NAD+)
MEREEIRLILENQKRFFETHKSLDIRFRINILKRIKSLIIGHEQDIKDALWKDFHKPACEVISSETQFVIKELNLAIRKLKRWAKPKRVRTPLVHFIARSYISPQPYGQVLVLSPWNFPFQLSFIPVISALAAGNCVVLKMSQRVPFTSNVIKKIADNFSKDLFAVISGDHSISDYLLDYNFDYIFFTGSSNIGRHVMGKAALHLTPVTLELGGKSPCVVTADARLDYAVKRIAWGKFYNAGQTCVAPDYVLIDNKIKERFLDLIIKEIKIFYGDEPEQSDDYPRVIDEKNASRLESLMTTGKIVIGGKADPGTRFVSPTVIKDIRTDDPIMKGEIFGPVLPVIGYENLSEVYDIIERNPKPLSAYIFTRNKKSAREFLAKVRCGSAAINDTVVQFATPFLPFGGVGPSGMGRYHGRKSFETFSNMRAVMVKSNLIDFFVRYPPYTKFKEKVFKWVMR